MLWPGAMHFRTMKKLIDNLSGAGCCFQCTSRKTCLTIIMFLHATMPLIAAVMLHVCMGFLYLDVFLSVAARAVRAAVWPCLLLLYVAWGIKLAT